MNIDDLIKQLNDMKLLYGNKVINDGNCMLCGKKIKIAVSRGNSKFPNIFFCPECERRVKKAEPQVDKEEK